MKPILFTLFILFATTVFAQVDLLTSFNSTPSGRNISLTISKTNSATHEFGAGLRYNIGMLAMPDDQQNIYYKRLYPSTFAQHFGVQGFYHRYILKSWEHVNPFLFYDIQAAYSTTRNNNCYSENTVRFGPFTWVEQNVGVGFKVDLADRFFISQKIGVGGMLIFGSDEQLLKTSANWEFGGLINFGVGYRFN